MIQVDESDPVGGKTNSLFLNYKQTSCNWPAFDLVNLSAHFPLAFSCADKARPHSTLSRAEQQQCQLAAQRLYIFPLTVHTCQCLECCGRFQCFSTAYICNLHATVVTNAYFSKCVGGFVTLRDIFRSLQIFRFLSYRDRAKFSLSWCCHP